MDILQLKTCQRGISLTWVYTCRHCQKQLGRIEESQATDTQLGLDQLTPDERKDIITSNAVGENQVWVTCESCQQVFDQYPERMILPHLFS